MSTPKIEQMKLRLATKSRQRREEALRGLQDLQSLSCPLTCCVRDFNGEPGNGWQPDLKEADRLASLMYWKTVRVHQLLTGTDTDGTDIEIALFEADA